MDPNTALNDLRELADGVIGGADGVPFSILDEADRDLIKIAEQFQALDEWLTRGGFKPAAWNTRPASATPSIEAKAQLAALRLAVDALARIEMPFHTIETAIKIQYAKSIDGRHPEEGID